MVTDGSWWRLTAAEWVAALAVLVATAFIVQPLFAQQASRMALTASVAEHGTVRIDRFEDGPLGVDFAEKDGHLYSDKAPAQPFAAVIPYLAYRAVGGESAEVYRTERNLGLWWTSVWSAALPTAALTVVMSRLARPWSARWALPSALALSFGSLLLPFSTLLFSHTASALAVGAAILFWRTKPASDRHLAVAGLLLGMGVATEYTAVVALAVVGLGSVLRDRWRCLWLAAGALLPLAATAIYHWVAFGGPLQVPYRYHNLGLHNSAAAGLTLPTAERLWTLITAERGLFLMTPVVLVGLVGLVVAMRERPDRMAELAVIAAVFAGFVVVQGGAADLTGGDSLGPRYVIPALPGLVVGVAVMWRRAAAVTAGAALAGATLMLVGTYTDPMVDVDTASALSYWRSLLREGDLSETLLSPVMGDLGILLVLLAAGVLAWSAVALHLRSLPPDRVSPPPVARASGP